jgi:5-methylcytosine-specific restriction endonuclease McrA
MNVLDKVIVLNLNRNWQPINQLPVRKAIVAMCSASKGEKPALALDIETAIKEDGSVDIIYVNPVKWEDWIKLPVRENDFYIQTAHQKIRVPTVIICAEYDKVPTRKVRFSKENIRRRDKDTCQVSGRKLKRGEGNIGHIKAKARGGKDTWENVVYMDKELNNKQGTNTPEEMGWTLINKPFEPKETPVIVTTEDTKKLPKNVVPFWLPFVIPKAEEE